MVARNRSLTQGWPSLASGKRAIAVLLIVATALPTPVVHLPHIPPTHLETSDATPATPVSNFTTSINRLVELVALAGSGILALVWARVAISWFSNDITKKIQAKDRARDALIGTLLFMAAVTGLLYGLAHWVLTGS
ncbi:MAG: hypothetical protein WB788_07490 [Thermoplasmata archaeon]